MQENFRVKGKKLYFGFVDFEKAFDRVPREVIRWAMRKLGVEEWLVLAGRLCLSFPLLLQQPPHFTTMFPYVCKGLLTFRICFHHYLFHLVPVFIYIRVFPRKKTC